MTWDAFGIEANTGEVIKEICDEGGGGVITMRILGSGVKKSRWTGRRSCMCFCTRPI
jgi:hypothetical protein